MAAGVSIVVCLLLQITCFSTLLDGTETFEGNDYVLYTLIYIYIVREIVLVVVVILQVTVLVADAVVVVSIRNLKCVDHVDSRLSLTHCQCIDHGPY